MRVIGGKYKNRKLFHLKDPRCRPTQDRVREAIFNVLQQYSSPDRVLDLFSGTGSLGIEALSRGASEVAFVDTHTQIIERNLKTLDMTDQDVHQMIHKMPAKRFIQLTKINYDLIFIDPPWTKLSHYESTLKAISEFGILSNQGLVVCEHPHDFELRSMMFTMLDTRKYGTMRITLLKQ